MNAFIRFWKWLREPPPNKNLPENTEPYFHAFREDLLFYCGNHNIKRSLFTDKFINTVLLATLAVAFLLIGICFTLQIAMVTGHWK